MLTLVRPNLIKQYHGFILNVVYICIYQPWICSLRKSVCVKLIINISLDITFMFKRLIPTFILNLNEFIRLY